jgi:hypothetical protein
MPKRLALPPSFEPRRILARRLLDALFTGRLAAALAVLLVACAAPAPPDRPAGAERAPRPKYGPAGAPRAAPLSLEHGYLRRAEAPDFWALIPYYAGQETDSSCSVAAAAMVINAWRGSVALNACEELATHGAILERAKVEGWRAKVEGGGRGLTLAEMGEALAASLEAYGLAGFEVEVTPVESADAGALDRLRAALRENERSASDIIIANFLQGTLTGDAEVGHLAPVAAYDAERRKVLLLDPDRRWYEPYWVDDERLLEAMAARDEEAAAPRGYIRVRRRAPGDR